MRPLVALALNPSRLRGQSLTRAAAAMAMAKVGLQSDPETYLPDETAGLAVLRAAKHGPDHGFLPFVQEQIERPSRCPFSTSQTKI